MNIINILLIKLLFFIVAIEAKEIQYTLEKVGEGVPFKGTYVISTTENITTVQADRERDESTYQIFDGDIIQWDFKSKVNDTQFILIKSGENIKLTGYREGKSRVKQYKAKHKLVLAFGVQLKSFFMSSQKERLLHVISSGDFRMVTMKIKRQKKQEVLDIGSVKKSVIVFKMSPIGVLGGVWKAMFYVDPNSGDVIQYVGPNGGIRAPKLTLTYLEN